MTKTILVTGASAGAGHAIARRFAREGFSVILAARRMDRLVALAEQIQGEYNVAATPLQCDLEDRQAVEDLYARASDIGFSVLVNNAGRGDWDFIWDLSMDELNALFDLNARAVAMLSTLFARDNRQRDACLINVASLAGYALYNAAIPYSATKFFVTAFTEGLSQDLALARSPMRAKLIAPGPIDTEFKSISMANTRLRNLDASGIEAHTAEEIADFTYQLYESDLPVGIVDMANMSFVMRDTVHPLGRLKDDS
jgi:short-subunit dehydrogenase